jgi:hypothetical protein
MASAKIMKLKTKGNRRIIQESEVYPFLHIKSRIKVQNKI